LSANVAEKTSKSKLTALFTVRRWLREIPCSAAQAQVLFALASFARPDGTGVHPGQNGLEAITKLDRRTIGRALKDWRTVGAVTRTQGGNRRLKQADEYKINLDWQPSNATVGHFCKSGPESHLKNSFGTSESSFGTLGSSNATPDRPIEESSSSKKHFIENARAHCSARKTAAPLRGLATQPENRPRVPENNSSEPEPFDCPSTTGEQIHLRREADSHGWTRQELKAFLKDEFNVAHASHLTHRQYIAALLFVEKAVPLPAGLRNPRVQ